MFCIAGRTYWTNQNVTSFSFPTDMYRNLTWGWKFLTFLCTQSNANPGLVFNQQCKSDPCGEKTKQNRRTQLSKQHFPSISYIRVSDHLDHSPIRTKGACHYASYEQWTVSSIAIMFIQTISRPNPLYKAWTLSWKESKPSTLSKEVDA